MAEEKGKEKFKYPPKKARKSLEGRSPFTNHIIITASTKGSGAVMSGGEGGTRTHTP
jgi:hypothetical protein